MQIIMPKLGLTMTHGTITEWLKAPGDAVRAEESLCTYETEKVTLELPAPEDGVLVEILAPAGTTVAAGAAVCEFQTAAEERRGRQAQEQGSRGEGERGSRGAEGQRSGGAEERGRGGVEGRGQLPAGSFQQPASSNLLATPKARVLARQLGMDLATVRGTGPDGRVHAADVLAVGAGSPRPAPARGEIKATPLARRIAASEGVDLAALAGTGPEGTITREDVERVVRGQGAEVRSQESGDRNQGSGVRDQESGVRGRGPDVSTQYAIRSTEYVPPTSNLQPLTSLRRTIAERMTQSAFTAPHVTLFTEAEATNLVSARAQLNAELSLPPAAAGGTGGGAVPPAAAGGTGGGAVPPAAAGGTGGGAVPPAAAGGTGGGAKLSYNTLLAALVARALREYPNLNATWEPDGIRLLAEINIALAVDTERGLLTPVLRNVDKLSLSAIQAGYTELANRAVAGKSLPDDFAGGTFTITNLGSLDVDGFTPIINPPQAAILGVGRIVEKPVARDSAVVIRPMITLSLSFDHRIVDGAPAAKFLQRVKQLVERPMALLLRDA